MSETEYVFEGFDEYEAIKPASEYQVSRSRKLAWEVIQKTDGLTTVIMFENAEPHTVEGRAEILGAMTHQYHHNYSGVIHNET